MKKLIATLLIGTTLLTSAFGSGPSRTSMREIQSLVTEYRHCRGFETVNVGSFLLGIAKAGLKLAADDQDVVMVANLMNDLKRISVIEYGDCCAKDSAEITRRVKQIVSKAELLVSVNDDGEKINIYATPAIDGNILKDIVIWDASDKCLVCLFGSIDSQNIAKIMDIY